MLYWALLFLVLAIVLGFLGFGLVASAFAAIAKILFWIFLVVFIVSIVMHFSRSRA